MAGENNTALRGLRGIFVLLLVVLGGYSGYTLGAMLVEQVAHVQSSNMIISTYHELLTHGGAAKTTASLIFAALAALVVFLVATGIFNRLVRVGDQLKEMRADEKIDDLGFIEALLEHGADPALLGDSGHGWRGPRLSSVAIAARRGRRDVLDLLERVGETDELRCVPHLAPMSEREGAIVEPTAGSQAHTA